MISLKRWVVINGAFASFTLVVLTFFVFFSLSLKHILSDNELKASLVRDSASILEVSLSQSNRMLTESTLMGLQSRYEGSSVLLCDGEKVIFSYGHSMNGCMLSDSHFTFDSNLKGMVGIKLVLKTDPLHEYRIMFWYFVTLFLFLSGQIFIFIKLYNKIYNEIVKPISTISKEDAIVELFKIQELNDIADSIQTYRRDFERVAEERIGFRLAAQVSHDIRSPLAALEMVSSGLDSFGENKVIVRHSIERIRQIANSIIRQHRATTEAKVNVTFDDVNFEVIQLSEILKNLIAEKRIQYSKKGAINIHYDSDPRDYATFVEADRSDLLRVLSNLVNNAIEALQNECGEVRVSVHKNDKLVQIKVQDGGIGIPKDKIKTIGEYGVSLGKTDGMGLGLHHAKECVRRWGGKLELSSTEGVGTEVVLELPTAKVPRWFVNDLKVGARTKIIFVEEEFSGLNFLKSQLARIDKRFTQENLIFFTSLLDLKSFYRENFYELEDAIYFVHSGSDTINNQFQFLEQLGISHQAVLLVDSFDSEQVREEQKKGKVKILLRHELTAPLKLDI